MANGYNTDNYKEQGGARDVIGGSLDVISGGEVDIESGAAFKIAGTDVITKLAAVGALSTTEIGTIDLADTVGEASTGVTAVEYGTKSRHTTILTIADFTQAVAGAALGFGKSVYTFPEGIIKVRYATADVTITSATETGTPDIGVGTVVAVGEIDALNGTATFENIMDGFTATAITSGGSDSNNYVEAEAGLLDGHTTAVEAFLNFAETWTATETMTISATVTLIWDTLGTY